MRSTRSKKMLEMLKPAGTTNQGKIILKIFKFINVESVHLCEQLAVITSRKSAMAATQFLRTLIIYLTVLK